MLNGGSNLINGYESNVIIIVDEYDAPLNGCLDTNGIIEIMKEFFQALKGAKTVKLKYITHGQLFNAL